MNAPQIETCHRFRDAFEVISEQLRRILFTFSNYSGWVSLAHFTRSADRQGMGPGLRTVPAERRRLVAISLVTISLVVAPWAAVVRVSAFRMVSGPAVLPRVLNSRPGYHSVSCDPTAGQRNAGRARRERHRVRAVGSRFTHRPASSITLPR